jgi:transposase
MADNHLQHEVILGVDTHLDSHVGVVIDYRGKWLGALSVQANPTGYIELLHWAQSFGNLLRAGVEGTGTYGAGLFQLFHGHGIEVFEINRPDRSQRRCQGKSDHTDAESAARTVLSGKALAIPKSQNGSAEAMRTLSVARRSAVKARTQAINQLRARLISAPDTIRNKLWKSKPDQCVKGCAQLETLGDTVALQSLAIALRLLANRWLYLTSELCELDKTLESLTRQAANLVLAHKQPLRLLLLLAIILSACTVKLRSLHYVELIHYPHRLEKRYATALIVAATDQPIMLYGRSLWSECAVIHVPVLMSLAERQRVNQLKRFNVA